MWVNTEIGAVIHGRIKMCYLCFTYTPVFTVSLVLERVQMNEMRVAEVTFHSFFLFYFCATFRYPSCVKLLYSSVLD